MILFLNTATTDLWQFNIKDTDPRYADVQPHMIGLSMCAVRDNEGRFGHDALIAPPSGVTITADPENCVPGTVADRVTCTLCGAYWPGTYLPDGRPVLVGGVALARRYRQDRTWRWLAMRCRCEAGQRLPLADMVPLEWLWYTLRQLRAVRKGIDILSDQHLERFLIDPRGPGFSERWHHHLAIGIQKGRSMHVAKRAAYMRAFKEEFRS